MGRQDKTCPQVEMGESGSREVAQRNGLFFIHRQGSLWAETDVKLIIRKVQSGGIWQREESGKIHESKILLQAFRAHARPYHFGWSRVCGGDGEASLPENSMRLEEATAMEIPPLTTCGKSFLYHFTSSSLYTWNCSGLAELPVMSILLALPLPESPLLFCMTFTTSLPSCIAISSSFIKCRCESSPSLPPPCPEFK